MSQKSVLLYVKLVVQWKQNTTVLQFITLLDVHYYTLTSSDIKRYSYTSQGRLLRHKLLSSWSSSQTKTHTGRNNNLTGLYIGAQLRALAR